MTVSTSNTREIDIALLMEMAIFTAQLLPAGAATTGVQWDGLVRKAKNYLDMTVKTLQGSHHMPRHVDLYPITMVAGQASYTLPAGTLEVEGDGYYLPEGSTDGSTLVMQVERQVYVNLSSKQSEGIPTMYYSNKSVPLIITLWPVPTDIGTLTIQRERIIADSNDSTKTVELESYWSMYLTLKVASLMAMYDVKLSGYLRAQADVELKEAKSRAAQHAPSQVVVNHETPWS